MEPYSSLLCVLVHSLTHLFVGLARIDAKPVARRFFSDVFGERCKYFLRDEVALPKRAEVLVDQPGGYFIGERVRCHALADLPNAGHRGGYRRGYLVGWLGS